MNWAAGIPEELANELVVYLEPMMIVKPQVIILPPNTDANANVRDDLRAILGRTKPDVSSRWRAFIRIPTHAHYSDADFQADVDIASLHPPFSAPNPIIFEQDTVVVNIEYDYDVRLTDDCKQNIVAALTEHGVYVRGS